MNAIQLTAKLYECRDAAKVLCGDKYQERMQQLGQYIAKVAEREKQNEVSVALAMCKGCSLEGADVALVMAAAVELIEPSKVVS